MATADPLADLRARFVTRSRDRVTRLRALIDAAARGGAEPPSIDHAATGSTPAEAIIGLAHQLAGAAGTFGYQALSKAAAALEDRVRATGPGAQALDPRALEPLLTALEAQLAEIAEPAS